jgi:dTDP-4-dehydrorhamnose reductase
VDVLADQHGGPTWARLPAEALRDLLARLTPFAGPNGLDPRAVSGVYHAACAGPATWLEVACALQERWGSTSVLTPSARVPGPGVAPRPPWSVLDSARIARVFGVRLPDWREGLARCLAEER